MTNMGKLKGILKEKNVTQEEVAKMIGMDRTTLRRKFNKEGRAFTVEEVQKITKSLCLNEQEVLDIFFAK